MVKNQEFKPKLEKHQKLLNQVSRESLDHHHDHSSFPTNFEEIFGGANEHIKKTMSSDDLLKPRLTESTNIPTSMETSINPENNNINNDFNLESERTSLERQLSESSDNDKFVNFYRRNSAVSLLGTNQINSCRNSKNQKLKYLGKSSLPDLKLNDEYYIGRPSVIRKSCKIANNISHAIQTLPRRFSRKLSCTEFYNLPKRSSRFFKDNECFKNLVKLSLLVQLTAVIVLLVFYNHVNVEVKFQNFDEVQDDEYSNFLPHKQNAQHHRRHHKYGIREILNNMDNSVNPCEDFYKFSCGNWNPYPKFKKSTSGSIQPYVSRLSQAQKRGYHLLADQLNKQNQETPIPINSNNWHLFSEEERSKRVVSTVFKQCVDYSRNVENKPQKSHVPWLKSLPSWPLITDKASEFKTVAELLIQYHRTIVDNTEDLGLFRFMITHKTNNMDKPIIGIAQLGLYFTTKEYYTSYELSQDNLFYKELYVNLVKNVAKEYSVDLGLEIDNMKIEEDAEDVYELESYLANLTVSQRDSMLRFQNNHHHSKMITLNEFATSHPYIGEIVKMVIQDVYNHQEANPIIKSYFIQTVVDQGNLFIKEINPEYFEMLNENLPFSLKTIQNWLMFRAVQAKTFALPKRYRDIQNEANSKFHKIDRKEFERMIERDKESTCIQVLGQYYQWQLSHIYTELIGKYDRSQTLKYVNKTTEAIGTYETMMMPNDWLDRETSKSALEKLDEMVTLLGYEVNGTLWKKAFLVPDENATFFETILKYEKTLSVYKLALFPQMKIRNTWQLPAHMVNAFYSPVYNAFTIPLGIMGNSSRNTPAVNYGRLGSIIGHEISHGFDSYGRKFNEIGDFENWWTNFTEQGYDERSECFLKQFNDVKFDEVDSELTLAENIADSAGLKASYLALQTQHGKLYLDRVATGTRFTNKQLFFIAFAQNSCSRSTPEYDLLAHRTNTHAPDKYRVLGTLSNQPEFAEAFQCKPTDTYNPKTKCSIW